MTLGSTVSDSSTNSKITGRAPSLRFFDRGGGGCSGAAKDGVSDKDYRAMHDAYVAFAGLQIFNYKENILSNYQRAATTEAQSLLLRGDVGEIQEQLQRIDIEIGAQNTDYSQLDSFIGRMQERLCISTLRPGK